MIGIDLPEVLDPTIVHLDRTYSLLKQYWLNIQERRRSLSGTELKTYEETVRREIKFFLLYGMDPGFHQSMNKETDYTHSTRKKGLTIRKDLNILTSFVILDNLSKEYGRQASMNEARRMTTKPDPSLDRLQKSSAGSQIRPLSYKTLHRFGERYYPELIMSPIRLRRLLDDNREAPFETPFSKDSDEGFEAYREMLVWSFGEPSPEVIQEFILASSNAIPLRLCESLEYAKLSLFRKDTLKTIGRMKEDFNDVFSPNELETYWLFQHFEKYGVAVQVLFQELHWYTLLRWFRKKDSLSQEKILSRLYPLGYKRQDARNAVRECLIWSNDPGQVFGALSNASNACAALGQRKMGVYLMLECLKQLKLNLTDKALCYHNVSMTYRGLGKLDESLETLKSSIEFWKEAGGHLEDQALEYAYIAEVYRSQGNSQQYDSNKLQSEELIRQAQIADRQRAYFYLHLADCSFFFGDRDWETRWLSEGLKITPTDDQMLQYYLYSGQCLDDYAIGLSRRGAEFGPGRVRHPPEWHSVQRSSFFSETFV